jgi:hypothetical protein
MYALTPAAKIVRVRDRKGEGMPKSTFRVELSMQEAPAEAQERAATALIEPARAVGFKRISAGTVSSTTSRAPCTR